jgi:AmmeMemoRadiSam system protein B
MGKRNWQYLLVALAITLLAWMVYDVARSARTRDIPIVLAPHFDGAKSPRMALFQELAKQTKPQTIVILSPNHYQAGSGGIIATAKDWRLARGWAWGDRALEGRLSEVVSVDATGNSFLNEHGINNLLPELYQFFPESKYLAVMVREGTKKAAIDQLYEYLKANCADCLVVASVDFSHYVSSEVAQKQDEAALRVLTNLDANGAWQVKADSPAILYLVTRWAKETGGRFHLVSHSDAATEFKTPPADNVSYILGYYTKR